MNTSVEQFSKVPFYINRCRVCLEKSEKLYPLEGQVANVETTISDMIACCTSLEVEFSDDLPQGVCVPCFRTIRIAYNFINQYKETRKILIENRVKTEKSNLKVEADIANRICIEKKVAVDNLEFGEINRPDIEIEEQNEIEGEIDQEEIETEQDEIEEQEFNNEDEVIEEDNCSTECDLEFENMEEVQQVIESVNEGSNIECIFESVNLENSKQDESVEQILIVTENESIETENLDRVEIEEQKPKYTLRWKIVSHLMCPKCSKEFSGYDKRFKDHIIQQHTREVLSCNLCSQKNLRVKEYLYHFEEVHRYQCPICHESFLRNSARLAHMKEHSNILYKQSNLNSLELDNNLNDLVVQEHNYEDGSLKKYTEKQASDNYRRRFVTHYRCPKCPDAKPYSNYEKGFLNHVLLQHNHEIFNCNLCSKTNLNIDEFLRHFEQIHRHQCPVCYKSFNRISTKQVHMKTHSNIRYECTYCGKSFYASWLLRKHLNRHTELVKYTCNECGYSSATYDNYRYHLMKHQGPKHLCTYCGQSFLLAVHLKYHMWKHTGIKYFKCDQCSKSYTSGAQLKKHKRRHH